MHKPLRLALQLAILIQLNDPVIKPNGQNDWSEHVVDGGLLPENDGWILGIGVTTNGSFFM